MAASAAAEAGDHDLYPLGGTAQPVALFHRPGARSPPAARPGPLRRPRRARRPRSCCRRWCPHRLQGRRPAGRRNPPGMPGVGTTRTFLGEWAAACSATAHHVEVVGQHDHLLGRSTAAMASRISAVDGLADCPRRRSGGHPGSGISASPLAGADCHDGACSPALAAPRTGRLPPPLRAPSAPLRPARIGRSPGSGGAGRSRWLLRWPRRRRRCGCGSCTGRRRRR